MAEFERATTPLPGTLTPLPGTLTPLPGTLTPLPGSSMNGAPEEE